MLSRCLKRNTLQVLIIERYEQGLIRYVCTSVGGFVYTVSVNYGSVTAGLRLPERGKE